MAFDLTHSCLQHPNYFVNISLTKAIFRKYLEKCWSKSNTQHAFEYFVNLWLISKLLTNFTNKHSSRWRLWRKSPGMNGLTSQGLHSKWGSSKNTLDMLVDSPVTTLPSLNAQIHGEVVIIHGKLSYQAQNP